MTRIFALLSIVLLTVAGWFVYSQNILGVLFNPSVIVLEAKANIEAESRVRLSQMDLVRQPIVDIEPGMITFPIGVSEEDVVQFLSSGRTLIPLSKGAFVNVENFGQPSQIWQIRSMDSVAVGDPIDTNLLDVLQTESPDEGALIFVSRSQAEAFANSRTALRASRQLNPGDVLTLDDFGSSESGTVFILESVRRLEQGAIITPADVRPLVMPATDIPRGTISFPSRSGADIFVAASNTLSLTFAIERGTVLTVEMLQQGSSRVLRDMSEGADPTTLAELVELQSLDPLSVKFINLNVSFPDLDVAASTPLIGGTPAPDLVADLWVETERTGGPFGTIRLRRFVTDIVVQQVVDPELVLSSRESIARAEEQERSGATPPAEDQETDAQKGVFYWANLTRVGGLAYEEALDEDRLAFLMASHTPISDFLGNGVTCREDVCTISRSISTDLADVRTALDRIRSLGVEESAEGPTLAAFSVIDGVSPELEALMHENGHETFLDVAGWEDVELPVIEFNLGISRSLVVYIREQARRIVEIPAEARRSLGISPTESFDQ